MATVKLTRDDCIFLLKNKQAELNSNQLDRFPRRSDFTDSEVMAIKAFLGPWPRALEAAGIKELRTDDRLTKNREKRARAKRKIRESKLTARKENTENNDGQTE